MQREPALQMPPVHDPSTDQPAHRPTSRPTETSFPAPGQTPRPEKPSFWRSLRTAAFILLGLVLLTAAVLRIMHTRQAAQQKGPPGGRRGPAGPGGPPVPVLAGTVQQKDVPIYLNGLGTIQALNTVTVRARVDGQIDKIAFQEGQDVKAGDLLAQIDPAPLQAALDQVLAKKRQDEVALANAQRDLQRDRELAAKKVIASQQLDYQAAQVEQAAALVKNDEAVVANARVQLAYTTITSPLDGRTGIRLVDQGNIVRASDATGLVVITQLHPISLLFTLPEQSLTQVHDQQVAAGPLEVQAIARDNKTVLSKGKLTVIDNQIDTTTGTVKLKAEFENTDNKLWPGQFVNARLLVTTRQGGLVVPASVIQRGPESAYAYVIKPDNTVEMRTVKVGQIDEGEALVDEGLNAGEKVVVDGQYKLQAGATVKLADGAGPRSAGGRPPGAPNPGGHAGPKVD